MRSNAAIIAAGSAGPSIPPIPALTNTVRMWSLWDWRDGGDDYALSYTNGDSDSFSPAFPVTAPYALEWGSLVAPSPYLLDQWGDQIVNTSPLNGGGGAATPILDGVAQTVSLDGAQGFVSLGSLYPSGSGTGIIYLDFQSSSADGVIFETGTSGHPENNISIALDGNTLYCTINDESGHPNTKQVDLSTDTRYWVAFGWDNTQVTPADQTFLKINDSDTGVTSTASADLVSTTIGASDVNVGARDSVTSDFYTGNIWTIICNNTADDSTVQTSYYNRGQYLKSLAP